MDFRHLPWLIMGTLPVALSLCFPGQLSAMDAQGAFLLIEQLSSFKPSFNLSLLALLPLSLWMSQSLWAAGKHLSGPWGGWAALFFGILPTLSPNFPLAALSAGIGAGLILSQPARWIPSAILALFLIFPLQHSGTLPQRLAQLSSESVYFGTPILLISVILALLLRKDGAAVRPLGFALALALILALSGHPSGAALIPALALAAAALRGGPWVAALGLLRCSIFIYRNYHSPIDHTAMQQSIAALQQNTSFALLAEVSPAPWALWLWSAGHWPVVVDEGHPLKENTHAALIIDVEGTQPRAGWRALLPPPTRSWAVASGTALFWDRGLPLDDMQGDLSEHHPSQQALYVRLSDGSVQGPLLAPVSSVAVARVGERWVMLFVRQQGLWRAESGDGLSWASPVDMGIPGFDPSIVAVPGGWRVFYAALVGDKTDVDPAQYPTQILSLFSSDLLHFQPEAGPRLVGMGMVDPSVILEKDRWALYYTAGRSEIRRAYATDGLNFEVDSDFHLLQSTVPEVLPHWLIVQRQVGRDTALYRLPLVDSVLGPPEALELCGTGAAWVADRLYFSRSPDLPPCGPDVVLPERWPHPW